MSSTELAATSTTRENAGELKPHAYPAATRIWFTVWNGIPGAGHYLLDEKPD